MRRSLIAALLALGVVGATVSIAAADPPGPSVFGHATWNFASSINGDNVFTKAHFTAHALPHVDGHVHIKAVDTVDNSIYLEYTGQVDCLRVSGNEAWISGTITEEKGAVAGNRYFEWALDDGDDNGGQDLITVTRYSAPFSCSHNLVPLTPIQSGNVEVIGG